MERDKPGDATWDEYAALLGFTKQAMFSWFAGNMPSLRGFASIAERLRIKRWEVMRLWEGD